MDCPFCQIIEGKKPAKVFFEDDHTIVFADILPRAKIHLLICPKRHSVRLVDMPEKDFLNIMKTAQTTAHKLGVIDNFRLILNNGIQAGQIIDHIHFHFLSNQAGVNITYCR